MFLSNHNSYSENTSQIPQKEQQAQQTQPSPLPVFCAWHEPVIEHGTSTICRACMKKYFPKYCRD